MYFFQVDARDNFSGSLRTCNFCCADKAAAIPGEMNAWRIDYSPWVSGIQGRGLSQPIGFSISKLTTNPPPPFPSDLPPTNTDYTVATPINTTFSGGDVSTNAISPGSHTLTFYADPVNLPRNGVVAMNSDGSYIYVPNTGYSGLDQFGFFTSDGINPPVENIVTVKIPSTTNIPPNLGLLYVDPTSVRIHNPFLDFKVVASEQALVDQVYRLTVSAIALDCDIGQYRHISTYDIAITKCGF